MASLPVCEPHVAVTPRSVAIRRTRAKGAVNPWHRGATTPTPSWQSVSVRGNDDVRPTRRDIIIGVTCLVVLIVTGVLVIWLSSGTNTKSDAAPTTQVAKPAALTS